MTARKLALSAVAVLAVILGGGTVLVDKRAGAREARAEALFPPQGQIIDIGGTPVHAFVTGSGPDLVLIHGSSGNLRDFTFRFIDALKDRYRVIAIDRPGLGYTGRLSRHGGTISEQAALLRAAAVKLGAERPIVLGQSYGGAVALAWAVNHPENIAALVPVAAPSNPWNTPLSAYYRITSSRLGGWIGIPLLTAFVPDRIVARAISEVFLPQAEIAGYADHIGAPLTLRRGSLRANARQRAALRREIIALYPRYGEISVPTEIVHGTADTTVSIDIHSERLAGQIPGAVLTRLEGVGHMPHQVAPEATIAAIDRAAARAGLR